jgi:hypothetical protein
VQGQAGVPVWLRGVQAQEVGSEANAALRVSDVDVLGALWASGLRCMHTSAASPLCIDRLQALALV